jgi:acylphosphatase
MEVKVTGSVQGVGFRFFVIRRAGHFGLNGWTKNMPDGSVFVVAEGPEPALREFLGALREGPPSAAVSEVSFTLHDPLNEPAGFYIR